MDDEAGQLTAEPSSHLSRRTFLRSSALAGGTVLAVGLAACGDSSSASPTALPMAGPAPDIPVPSTGPVADPAKGVNFFAQEDLNFETLFSLGAAGAGTAEAGEVIATVNQINAAGPSYQTYYENFVATAERVGKIADEALEAGHLVSARSAYLRSAAYFDAALFVVLGTSTPDREEATYAAMQRQWNLAAQLFDPPFERVAIPYEGTTMPGYFLKPDSSDTRRPTVIVTNGSDGQNVDTYAYGGAAAIERGYNALLYEGPGQGSMLFERQIFFRPDWEKVVSPIVDYLHSRSDVDTAKIAITGWSEGGALVARAAASEHRLAAVVADPGVVDPWLAFPASLRDLFTPGATSSEVNGIWKTYAIPSLTTTDRFDLAKRSEIFARQFLLQARAGQVLSDVYELGQKQMQYKVTDVVERITTPTLVTNYQLESFYPGQAAELYHLLRSTKAYNTFTIAEGAEYHCAPLAPQRRNQVVFDWLDKTLGQRG